MLQGVDLNEVKQYNSSLKQYRDKAANINAQIEFTQRELSNLCKELSAELGVEVNESNVEQIYNEQVEKINATLKSGNTVLAKIAEEEQKIASGVVSQTQGVPVQQATVPQATAPQANAQSATIPQPTPPAMEQPFEGNSTAGSVFGNGQVLGGGAPLFKLG